MVTEKLTVSGLVQGIGFRPFVAELAEQLGLKGWVRNCNGIVNCQVTGEQKVIDEFIRRIRTDAPDAALVEGLDAETVQTTEYDSFLIVDSEVDEQTKQGTVFPADLPTCARCEKELFDPANRRYRHPFISCTDCGPRYSILEAIPYDRSSISMKKFPMCQACADEYRKKGDIRRHAQTIACKDCGPRLTFRHGEETIRGDEAALERGIEHLRSGGILAVKDIGGYHLAVDPYQKEAVKELRRLKGREKKPFAVMFRDTASVRRYCHLDDREEKLLRSSARPIVLLKRKETSHDFCAEVCQSSPDIGAMLPCNPLQILLSEACGPLVMTSANVTGALITTDDACMYEWLDQDAVAVLSHDRMIVTPLDDSIVRMVSGRPQTLRRARGMVPVPVAFPYDAGLLAYGGDLKACFCYVDGKKAYLSQHLGDLMDEDCFLQYQTQLRQMKTLFDLKPEQAIADLHPLYRSGRLAERETDGNLLRLQHHMAHVWSVITEQKLEGKTIGFAFDGTGYGTDGSIWGSEVFLWNGDTEMERVAHLLPIRMIGGDEGARNADLSLYAYLFANGLQMEHAKDDSGYQVVSRALAQGIHTILSTSMGRLFDAVSALLDCCHRNSYEGEAAIELENLAATTNQAVELKLVWQQKDGECLLDTRPLFEGILKALDAGHARARIARGFLYALADACLCLCIDFRQSLGISQVALSGGTFLNRILLERLTEELTAQGFVVYRNELVPPGDGGLCLGQAGYAARVEMAAEKN